MFILKSISYGRLSSVCPKVVSIALRTNYIESMSKSLMEKLSNPLMFSGPLTKLISVLSSPLPECEVSSSLEFIRTFLYKAEKWKLLFSQYTEMQKYITLGKSTE